MERRKQREATKKKEPKISKKKTTTRRGKGDRYPVATEVLWKGGSSYLSMGARERRIIGLKMRARGRLWKQKRRDGRLMHKASLERKEKTLKSPSKSNLTDRTDWAEGRPGQRGGKM